MKQSRSLVERQINNFAAVHPNDATVSVKVAYTPEVVKALESDFSGDYSIKQEQNGTASIEVSRTDVAELKALLVSVCPDCLKESLSEAKEGETRFLKHRGNKWVLLQRGTEKVIGEHPSREKALKQLKAIEYKKHESIGLSEQEIKEIESFGIKECTTADKAKQLPTKDNVVSKGLKLPDDEGKQVNKEVKPCKAHPDREDAVHNKANKPGNKYESKARSILDKLLA